MIAIPDEDCYDFWHYHAGVHAFSCLLSNASGLVCRMGGTGVIQRLVSRIRVHIILTRINRLERSENPVLSGKFQIANTKYQTNHNDRNSKFETLTCVSKNTHWIPVWIIGYWNLRFVCNLVLVYCFLHKMQRNNN